jgi:hypothetical protein
VISRVIPTIIHKLLESSFHFLTSHFTAKIWEKRSSSLQIISKCWERMWKRTITGIPSNTKRLSQSSEKRLREKVSRLLKEGTTEFRKLRLAASECTPKQGRGCKMCGHWPRRLGGKDPSRNSEKRKLFAMSRTCLFQILCELHMELPNGMRDKRNLP